MKTSFFPISPRFALGVALAAGLTQTAFAQPPPPGPGANPFLPPNAKVHYAPDRDYDLKNLKVVLKVDYAKRQYEGVAYNTLAPLRANGLTQVRFDCGKGLKVSLCEIAGKTVSFKHDTDAGSLLVTLPEKLPQGKDVTIAVSYLGGNRQGSGFGQGGEAGFHWMTSDTDKTRVGFWTQGETSGNRNWAPTWDYPNDFCTTETVTTVPADWTVVGNGVKTGDVVDKAANTRTVTWKMTQEHATYLLSLVAGPFDVKTANWQGVPLLYVVPKGKGELIDPSFGDTPDMLSFFSKITGVKYPWPKYAQNAMYDFGGGMENVSATTLGENSLTDGRDGFRTMASLNSHELGHQWFGDYVTCKDWGTVWLNESFATYMENMYMEHSRGKYAYDREIEGDMQSYFREARRYKRPIVTTLYNNPDQMFDSHTYPKGGAVLHTIRRRIGDDAFFRGLNLYLTRNHNNPVETPELIRAFTEASGVNMQPFFDQWLYKPGHPVVDYAWTYSEGKGELSLIVKQTQDTSIGTPIYDIPTKVAVFVGGTMQSLPVTLNAAEQTITLKTAKPDAVILDPEHDFLREMKHAFAASELPVIVQYAPNAIDKNAAFAQLLKETPSDDAVKIAAAQVEKDAMPFPAIDNIAPLGVLKREDLRPLFRAQLKSPSVGRRTQGLQALSKLPRTDEEVKTAKAILADAKAPYPEVAAAAIAMIDWEPNEGVTTLVSLTSKQNPPRVRRAILNAIGQSDSKDPRLTEALRTAMKDDNFQIALNAVNAAVDRKDKALLPDIQALAKNPPANAPGWFPNFLQGAATDLGSN